MKKLISFLSISIFLSISVFSQERMSFKGISLNNTVEDFVDKLESKGFEKIGEDNGTLLLQGDFLNMKCYVGVVQATNSNTVWRVAAILPENETWISLRDEYFAVKELYQKKYGKGKSVEEFEGYVYNELRALDEDRCKYYTEFKTKEGRIIVSIEKSGYLKGIVRVIYEDKTNAELNNSNNLDDI